MAMPAAWVTCTFIFAIGSKNLRLRLILCLYSSLHAVSLWGNSCEFVFNIGSKYLRLRLICFDPYREYNLKNHCVREDIGSGIFSEYYEKKKRYICIQSCLSSLNT
jgi:hypothetical protein